MGIMELQTSYPLIKTDKEFINYFDPKISLRINPSNMANSTNEERTIKNDNIFDIDRLGLIDTLESGNNLTLGVEFKKERHHCSYFGTSSTNCLVDGKYYAERN